MNFRLNIRINIYLLTTLLFVKSSNLGGAIRERLTRPGCDFKPKNILDVGANVGGWTNEFKNIFPDATFFMLEGNELHYSTLKATGVPFQIAIIADVEKNVSFFRDKRGQIGSGSSIFMDKTVSSTRDYYEELHAIAYPIDAIVKKNNLKPFQMVKMDIQGAELLAIEGAIETIKSVEVLLTEVDVMNYNQGSPPFLQIYLLLNSLGFGFYHIADESRDDKFHVVKQMDIIWVKKSSNLWRKECTGYPEPASFSNGALDSLELNRFISYQQHQPSLKIQQDQASHILVYYYYHSNIIQISS